MTTPDLYEKLLAKIDAIEKKAWRYVDGVIVEDSVASVFRALRAVVEMCSRNGYTTWDKSMVPLIDGKYGEEATKKWELAHGHDIRLKCYPEFGCQLVIDPEDLLAAVADALGYLYE